MLPRILGRIVAVGGVVPNQPCLNARAPLVPGGYPLQTDPLPTDGPSPLARSFGAPPRGLRGNSLTGQRPQSWTGVGQDITLWLIPIVPSGADNFTAAASSGTLGEVVNFPCVCE